MKKKQLIMDNCLRLTAFPKAGGPAAFMLTDVEDFQTTVEIANEKEITNHNGTTVAMLESGKKATISGNASFINFGLMAAQTGSALKKAITVPTYEAIEVAEDGTITLSNTPVGTVGNEIGFIYVLNEDGTLGMSYAQADEASTESGDGNNTPKFTLDGKKITLPSSVTSGTIGVFYDFESSKASYLENNEGEYGGVYIIKADILCRDICNTDVKTIVTVESKNAKLSSAYDLTWNSESKHPFSFKVNADYCDSKKNLLTTYILEDEE